MGQYLILGKTISLGSYNVSGDIACLLLLDIKTYLSTVQLCSLTSNKLSFPQKYRCWDFENLRKLFLENPVAVSEQNISQKTKNAVNPIYKTRL